MARKPGHRPGDIILDRFVPHLGTEEREIARERLRAWMRWKLRIIMRQVREEMAERDSRESDAHGTMDSALSPHP